MDFLLAAEAVLAAEAAAALFRRSIALVAKVFARRNVHDTSIVTLGF